MNKTIENTKNELLNVKARLIKTLDATPEERQNWSPSETSRTPIQLVAHCANSMHWLHTSFAGKPMEKFSTAKFDATHLEMDKPYTSRDQVVAFLDAESDAFVSWLDGVSDETLGSMWESPFGPVPMTMAIAFPGRHAEGHLSQLEYVQTIYGDRIWH